MILAFESEELRTVCEDIDAAVSKMGHEVADALRARVADLRAADGVDDVLVGNPRSSGALLEFLEVDLAKGTVMKFTANHYQPRVTDHGVVDWKRVTRLRLLEIEART